MSDERRAAGAAGGALGLGAIATLIGACCATSWTVGLLGVAGAVAVARMAWLQPYLLVLAFLLLALAFRWAHRKASARSGDCQPATGRFGRCVVWLVAALLAVLTGISFIPFGAASPSAAEPGYAALDGKDEPLRDDFNRAKGAVRLLFVVDPVCPTCVRGLADLNDELLANAQDPRLQTFVVHEPVIGGATKDIAEAAGFLHNPYVRHYWNADGGFGRRLGEAVGLRRANAPVYAWDVWLLYGPDAVWDGAAPPRPRLLMHQLEPIPGFSYLNSKEFAQQARALLAELPPARSTQ